MDNFFEKLISVKGEISSFLCRIGQFTTKTSEYFEAVCQEDLDEINKCRMESIPFWLLIPFPFSCGIKKGTLA